MTKIEITVEGKEYIVDITNNMKLLGELVVNEIKQQIRMMKLIADKKGGSYLQRWYAKGTNNGVEIESGSSYSSYLEFGTYAFGEGFGETRFPTKAGDSKRFKKKDLPKSIREMLPKGMIPFAPVRRVLYNQVIMKKLVKQAFAAGV